MTDQPPTVAVEFLGGPLEGRIIAQATSACGEGSILTLPIFDKVNASPDPLYRERYVVHWHGDECEAIHDGRTD